MKNELKTYIKDTPDITSLFILTNEDLTRATSLLSQLNKQLDAIKAHKEEKTKPLNAALKAIREDYRPYETILSEAIDSLKVKMTTYATLALKEKQAQEDKILADKRTTTETKIDRLSTLVDNPTEANTDDGSVKFYTIKKYRVLDITKVPHDLLQVNDTLIKELMKEGEPIPGIEFYEEQTLRNYRA